MSLLCVLLFFLRAHEHIYFMECALSQNVLLPLLMVNFVTRMYYYYYYYVHLVKIQSYVDDTTIIINQHNKIKYIYEIFSKHSRASEAAINMEKKNPKYSDLVIDMFQQNRSMTNSPKRLKTR